ncbi:hypothetical protein Aazo_0009 ['Nostoc azollae' 0708]|jgi:hypothetical protein|uniref:Uncharacterized protein n=1 Tax=Nostoc azollae (strain 0708) TaxID=551115 RepID=D7DVM3_NOSA0|nr:hypothetical protein Aazo_0009 ['Nostoc azollae' 0708]
MILNVRRASLKEIVKNLRDTIAYGTLPVHAVSQRDTLGYHYDISPSLTRL